MQRLKQPVERISTPGGSSGMLRVHWPPAHEHPAPSQVEEARMLYRRECFAKPADDCPEPFTLQWFLEIERERHERRASWIPQVLKFEKHAGETLLGLGTGLGTDWVQYARHGARVIVCSPRAAELSLVRKNFELRGLSARCIHAQPTALPVAEASIDVACVNGVSAEAYTSPTLVRELYRVLKPGGKVLALVPAYYSGSYWRHRLHPLKAFRSVSRLGQSRRSLKALFDAFQDHRIHKRHLRRRDVPRVLRWMPEHVLHRLIGSYLVLKAFKPIMPVEAAKRRLAA